MFYPLVHLRSPIQKKRKKITQIMDTSFRSNANRQCKQSARTNNAIIGRRKEGYFSISSLTDSVTSDMTSVSQVLMGRTREPVKYAQTGSKDPQRHEGKMYYLSWIEVCATHPIDIVLAVLSDPHTSASPVCLGMIRLLP